MAARASFGSGALWSAILNIGGVFLLAGSLGYSTMTLQKYEDQFGPLNGSAKQKESIQNATSAVAEALGPEPDAGTAQLDNDLEDARRRLAEAESRNASLRQRLDELEKQAVAQGGAAADADRNLAQCRTESTEAVSRLQQELANARDSLSRCIQVQ